MPYDLAALIRSGYGTGRQIGNDFASTRYSRAESKLRAELEQRAKEEGRPIEDYLDEYERRNRELAADKGVTRRAIEIDGRRLEDETGERYSSQVRGSIARRAGQKIAGGDLSGGVRDASAGALRMGDIKRGVELGQYSDNVDVGQKATRADGTVDEIALGRGNAANRAKYGDLEGAGAAQSDVTAKATKAANALYGRASVYLQSDTPESREAALGYINQALDLDTRWGSNLQARYDQANQNFVLTQGDQILDYIPAKEAPQWLDTFAQNPDAMLEQARAARSQDASARRQAQFVNEKEGRKAMSDFVQTMMQAGIPGAQARSLASATKQAQQAGWKLEGSPEESEDGSSFQMAQAPNGDLIRIQFDRPANLETGDPGAMMTFYDTEGNAVSPDSLEAADAIAGYAEALSAVQAVATTKQVYERLRTGLQLLNEVWGGAAQEAPAGGGGDTPTPEGASDVQSMYDDIGSQFGFETTSTTRSPKENEAAGGVPNSQHLASRGTARDWSVKGKTAEEIRAFVSALQAAGFEVITKPHGTGPHIHAELPPGGMRGRAVATVPQRGPALAAKQPTSGFLSGRMTAKDEAALPVNPNQVLNPTTFVPAPAPNREANIADEVLRMYGNAAAPR